MTFAIRVLSEPPRSVPALEGETILTSLLEAGVAFPHNCQSGNCGACKCELLEGDVLDLPHSEYALSAEERSRNLILACRTQVWSDCTVRPLEADETVLHPSRVMRCRVVGAASLTHDVKQLKLTIESGGPYSFSAGQHAKLKFGPGIPDRNYSMVNRPSEADLEFLVRLMPQGRASGYAFTSLHVGDVVTVSGPFGNAYWRENHRGPILAVAGGSGLAPILSIVGAALEADSNRRIHLYFGVRDERDVFFEGRLAELARRHPQLSVKIVLSEPSRPTARPSGFVSDAVDAEWSSLDGFKAYVAGPPPLVEALQRKLTAKGVPLRDVHADAFYSQADDAFNVS
ncbi:MAG TPA: 2Fe-2S iron-sulfur cluster-binding protein [Polyangiaceae bacterium]|nr:2Fe-2S iron-sulfur cluster-binding protein [Polyangiaceae bacterium]